MRVTSVGSALQVSGKEVHIVISKITKLTLNTKSKIAQRKSDLRVI